MIRVLLLTLLPGCQTGPARAADTAGGQSSVLLTGGVSARASHPWNFAAWNLARTLAILSVHGDGPLTRLTGSGQPDFPVLWAAVA